MYTELAKGFRCLRAKSQESRAMANRSGDHDKLGNESRECFDVLLDARFFEHGILIAVAGQMDNPGRSGCW
jgi:hypothetical protein